jgi:hypothetical protein
MAKDAGRKPLKQLINDYQQRRRAQALERQKTARKHALNKARQVLDNFVHGLADSALHTEVIRKLHLQGLLFCLDLQEL